MYSFVPISELKLIVYDHTGGQLLPHIRAQLVEYKKRWKVSIASNVGIAYTPDELISGVPVIGASYKSKDIPTTCSPTLLSSLGELTHYHLRANILDITVHYTKDLDTAKQWLSSFPYIVAFDSESTGLSVQLDEITMFSFACSEDEAYVISNESQEIQDYVLNYITDSEHKWVIHNASYDLKLVHHHTGKFPKDFEDTQLSSYTLLNNTNSLKAKVGLKGLVANIAPGYAVSKDLFGIEYKYSEELIKYSGYDAALTYYLFQENEIKLGAMETVPDFKDILPVGNPAIVNARHSKRYFYEAVLKPLVPAIVRVMNQGMLLDMGKVDALQEKLDSVLNQVQTTLDSNPLVKQFQKVRYSNIKAEYILERQAKQRDVEYYTTTYKSTDIVHRSYLVNYALYYYNINTAFNNTKLLPDGSVKWSVADINKLIEFEKDSTTLNELLVSIVDKTIDINSKIVINAMLVLAEAKAAIYNKKYIDDIEGCSEDKLLPPFSASSPKQKQELFDFLKIKPLAFSKTSSAPSWGRDQIEELQRTQTDPDIISILDAFAEHSTSAIVRNNFIKSFQEKSIDGVLRGSLKLGGTKS